MTVTHTYVIAHCLDCDFRNPFTLRRDAETWARSDPRNGNHHP